MNVNNFNESKDQIADGYVNTYDVNNENILSKHIHDSAEESEGENEVIEESPNGRWIKRKEPVSQRDVLAIDHAFLAMDTENGYEVVWNEISFSERRFKENKTIESKLDQIFNNLMKINHPNIVKFHGFWNDERNLRIIFITEYMASGSLKQFLRKAKKTNQPIKKPTWKRWCIQLLTALHYLHNYDPQVMLRELSCDTIYIQHNGLIKIGSISPDIFHTYVKTRADNWSKNLHFIAPEIHHDEAFGTPVDIYSFGIVALELFLSNTDLGENGDAHIVTKELIEQSIESLEDEKQKDFVKLCTKPNPKERPTAYQLLFHPLLFELPSLKRLAAHQFLKYFNESQELNIEQLIEPSRLNMKMYLIHDESEQTRVADTRTYLLATRGSSDYKYLINKFIEDLSKYLEDVKSGLFPLTAFLPSYKNKPISDLAQQVVQNNCGNLSGTQSPVILDQNTEYQICEKRKSQHISIKILTDDGPEEKYTLAITIKFEDNTKRCLEAVLKNTDTAISLAEELIKYGLISEVDKEGLVTVLTESLKIRDDKSEDKSFINIPDLRI